MSSKFTGTGVALVTPFNEDKSIDFAALGKVIDHCIRGGVNYLVALGTTGETVVLGDEEKQLIIDFCAEHINGRVPLVGGFGGNNTNSIIKDLKTFDLSKVDAILSSSPNYSKPTQEGIYQHYKAIAQSTDMPVILYNVPGRTAKNMTAATTVRLAKEFDNIIGTKDASCDMVQCMNIARNAPKDFLLISGDDAHALPMFSFGAKGVISVVAQATPSTFTSMVNKALAADFEGASEEQFKLLVLIDQIFKENNPAGIKAALHHLGLCKNELRLPLVPVSQKLYQNIVATLEGCE